MPEKTTKHEIKIDKTVEQESGKNALGYIDLTDPQLERADEEAIDSIGDMTVGEAIKKGFLGTRQLLVNPIDVPTKGALTIDHGALVEIGGQAGLAYAGILNKLSKVMDTRVPLDESLVEGTKGAIALTSLFAHFVRGYKEMTDLDYNYYKRIASAEEKPIIDKLVKPFLLADKEDLIKRKIKNE